MKHYLIIANIFIAALIIAPNISFLCVLAGWFIGCMITSSHIDTSQAIILVTVAVVMSIE